MFVLSFDPGKTTGIAYQNEDSVFMMGDTQDIYAFLESVDIVLTPVDIVVIEDYVILPHLVEQNVGVKIDALEVIGAIRAWAHRNKVPVKMYLPKMKPKQAATFQIFPKKMPKAQEHKFDAMLHGRYYLFEQKLVKSKLEEDRAAGKKLRVK